MMPIYKKIAMLFVLPCSLLVAIDRDEDQKTDLPLHVLILNQNIDTTEKLDVMSGLIKKVDINAVNRSGQTALNLETMKSCDPLIIRFLIESGADVNRPDFFNTTPLHNAMKKGNKKAVLLLLAAGAHTKISTDQELFAFDYARTPEMIHFLKEMNLFAND
jgi:ankyrin repeat protein